MNYHIYTIIIEFGKDVLTLTLVKNVLMAHIYYIVNEFVG